MSDKPFQLDKFKEAPRYFETDEDPERFEERLSELVKHRPMEKGTSSDD